MSGLTEKHVRYDMQAVGSDRFQLTGHIRFGPTKAVYIEQKQGETPCGKVRFCYCLEGHVYRTFAEAVEAGRKLLLARLEEASTPSVA